MYQSQPAKALPFKVLTVSNFFSFLRIVLAPVVSYFLLKKMYVRALISFVCAATTDAFDGYFARLLNEESSLGVYLDPIADKMLITICFMTLLLAPPTGIEIPSWFVLFVCIREVGTFVGAILLYLAGMRERHLSPTLMGKVTVVAYLALLVWLLIAGVMPELASVPLDIGLYAIVAMALFSSSEYVLRAIQFLF